MWKILERKKAFKDLQFVPVEKLPFGIKASMFFDNGFGCSVVLNLFSYGGTHGFYEIAVLKGTSEEQSEIYYSEKIFGNNGIKGWLDEDGVTKAMKQIQKLKQ